MCLSQLSMWYWSWPNGFAVLTLISWLCLLLALQPLENVDFVKLVQPLARVAVLRLPGWVSIRMHWIQEIVGWPLRVVGLPLVHTWLIWDILPLLIGLKPRLGLLNQLIKEQPLHHWAMIDDFWILEILLLAPALFMVGNENFFLNLIVHSPVELELALALIANYPW